METAAPHFVRWSLASDVWATVLAPARNFAMELTMAGSHVMKSHSAASTVRFKRVASVSADVMKFVEVG